LSFFWEDYLRILHIYSSLKKLLKLSAWNYKKIMVTTFSNKKYKSKHYAAKPDLGDFQGGFHPGFFKKDILNCPFSDFIKQNTKSRPTCIIAIPSINRLYFTR
jgi:hypothetical protein